MPTVAVQVGGKQYQVKSGFERQQRSNGNGQRAPSAWPLLTSRCQGPEAPLSRAEGNTKASSGTAAARAFFQFRLLQLVIAQPNVS